MECEQGPGSSQGLAVGSVGRSRSTVTSCDRITSTTIGEVVRPNLSASVSASRVNFYFLALSAILSLAASYAVRSSFCVTATRYFPAGSPGGRIPGR